MRSDLLAALLGTAIVCTTPAVASPTIFTYQGHLSESGEQAEGDFEFEVRLLDENGLQLSNTQFASVQVVAGAFSVELDFGNSAFNGSERYREISVRSVAAGGAYTTLSPNQLVTSTPVAQFALSGNEGPQGPGGSQGVQGEQGLQGNPGSDGTDGTDGAVGGQGIQGEQGPQGSSGAQGLQGNPGTPGDSHWALNGSTTYYTAGEVGVGTSSPSFPLHVVTGEPDFPAIYATGSGRNGQGIYGRALDTVGFNYGVWGESLSVDGSGVYGLALTSSGVNFGVKGRSNSADGRGVFGFVSSTQGSGQGVRGEASGNGGSTGVFGITTASIGGNRGVWGLSESSTGTGVYGFAFKPTGVNYGVWGKTNSDSGYAGYFEGGKNYFQGMVGVGTTSPSDQLHVNAPSGVNAFRVQTNGLTRIRVNESGGVSLGGNSSVVADGNIYIVNKLGIGDSTPEEKLDVVGNAVISGILTVGTTTAQTTYKLAVSGTAAKTGGGSWAVFSDQRLKKNITSMTGSLDVIDALRPVNFEYTVKDHFSYIPGVQRGFIAQEVQKVIPQWVNIADDGYFYLDQMGYEALIVDAIQELRDEKDAEIQELRARLNRLERMMALSVDK